MLCYKTLQNSGAKQKFKVLNLGSTTSNAARSWNIANYLPSIYKTLTANNFGIYSIGLNWTQGSAVNDYTVKSFSYNAANGTLSIGRWVSWYWDNDKYYNFYCAYYVRCYYIE